jgi:hypothetical protein
LASAIRQIAALKAEIEQLEAVIILFVAVFVSFIAFLALKAKRWNFQGRTLAQAIPAQATIISLERAGSQSNEDSKSKVFTSEVKAEQSKVNELVSEQTKAIADDFKKSQGIAPKPQLKIVKSEKADKNKDKTK